MNSYKTEDGIGIGNFISILSGLSPGTNYYVRAYATNEFAAVYGPQIQFITRDGIPILTTTSITDITTNTAIGGGEITNDGGDPITARGVCWNTTGNPIVSDSKTLDGSGTGSYISSITGLTPNATYFTRAYGTNSLGTGYGEEIQFITKDLPGTPTTIAITNITTTSAMSGGEITFDGNTPITSSVMSS